MLGQGQPVSGLCWPRCPGSGAGVGQDGRDRRWVDPQETSAPGLLNWLNLLLPLQWVPGSSVVGRDWCVSPPTPHCISRT